MNTLNMQMYKDGNRTILVFNNCAAKLNEVISKIVSEVGGEEQTIQNVNPISLPEPTPPVINQNTDVCNINEHAEVESNGFRGFVKVYQFWKQNYNRLPQQRSAELNNFFRMYANVLRNTPASSYSDEALADFLQVGLQTVFSDKLERLLREGGFITMDELLHGGRPVLEYSYNVCVGIN